MQTRFIFVSGGVLSGLGKGIASASIGLLLKSRGFKVTAIKIDPYVSIDAGTMRPAEHGEVFVTDDGGEIDQDIGHYERFLNLDLSKDNNITTGKVFRNVIHKERHFFYKGRDAEMIPDVVNEIKEMIYKVSEGFEFAIVEIGGTTGDLENMPFLHAAREMGKDHPAVYIMVTYLPFLRNVGELKTKPTQHAVARLREIGIVPDFIITRNEIPVDQPRIETIAKRCFISEEDIIDDPDIDLIYKVPLFFEKKKFAQKILKKFGVQKSRKKDLKEWKRFVYHLEKPKGEIQIALVGKYVTHGADKHKDVYVSVLEALNHAAAFHRVKMKVLAIDSERLERNLSTFGEYKTSQARNRFTPKDVAGIIVPQGWGSRGVEGKIKAVQFARENRVPYLGLCFGMQMAVIEFARNVLDLKEANSTEVNSETPHPVIHIMPDQKKYLEKHQYGGTIRLGAWKCEVKKDTLLYHTYTHFPVPTSPPDSLSARLRLDEVLADRRDSKRAGRLTSHFSSPFLISERHRHRYEFNNWYRRRFEKAGMVISGTSPDGKLVEAIEIPDHPFFIGTQFHPEYKSRPLNPHPLFVEFIKASKNKK